MTDAQLETAERDAQSLAVQAIKHIERETGRPFAEVSAERIADDVHRNPAQMLPWLRRLVEQLPGLALLLHKRNLLPDQPWLKDAAEQRPAPKKNVGPGEYLTAALALRDANEGRWLAAKEKIGNPEIDQSAARVEELMAWAKWYGDAHTLGAHNPLKAHLREQRIDALASFLAWLSKLQGKREAATGSRRERSCRSSPPA
jgi:hypothetical protein